MRILLDECVNPRVRQAFPHHKVVTVAEVEWRALPDAELIAQAQGECDVLVTIDKGFEHEHNLKKLGKSSTPAFSAWPSRRAHYFNTPINFQYPTDTASEIRVNTA